MCQVLYRDDGAPLGCVLRPPQRRRSHLRLHDHGRIAAPGRACSSDDAARRAVRSSARAAPRRARRGRRTPGVGPLFGLFRPDLARRRPEAPGGPARATISWEFECLLSMFSG
jgi:hypothetical protein